LKKKFKNGFAYKFTGTDKMVHERAEFAKTVRACCDFFVFNLSIGGGNSDAWLKIKSETKQRWDFIFQIPLLYKGRSLAAKA